MSESIKEHLPHRRMEAWKWTDVHQAVNENMSGLNRELTPKFEYIPDVTLNELHPKEEAHFHLMEKIALSQSNQFWHFGVEENVACKEPLEMSFRDNGHALTSLWLGENSSLTIIEYHNGNNGSFSNVYLKALLKPGAKLTRIIVQNDPADAVRVATSEIFAEEGAQYSQFVLSFGGKLSRIDTRLAAIGKDVQATLNGAYLLDESRHSDLTSHIDLKAPNSEIRQSVKGVVFDKARGVFQGKFHVERPAQQTDAEMRHDALLMSDRAEIRSKPELGVYADHVECAHCNTIGALDVSALFYMRQRGIPLARAKSLLIEAFLVGVFDDLDDDALRESLSDKVRDWLEAKL